MKHQGGGPNVGLVIEHPERGVMTGLWPFGPTFGYRTTWSRDPRKARVWANPTALNAAWTLMPEHMREGCRVVRYTRRTWGRRPIIEEMAM